jgi:hypothetical protein
MKIFLLFFVSSLAAMQQESSSHIHHTSDRIVKDIYGTISTPDLSQTYQVDLRGEIKHSHESDESNNKYTPRFVLYSNATTAIISAAISGGVTIAVAYSKWGKQ